VETLRLNRHVGLARGRLFDQLDGAGGSEPALVIAPAGFGKTFLLGQYAKRHAGPVAAYQADAMEVARGDTSARLLDAVLSGAGGSATPDPARTLGDAQRIVAAAPEPSTVILEAMGRAALEPGGLLLTVDGIDHLIGTPGETVLAQVVARCPRNVRIVLAGRRPPGAVLMRHELTGYGVLIGADDLRFRRWEVERLLEDVYGEPLPSDPTAQLVRRTGGWPAGLGLFHRATRGRPLGDRCRSAVMPLERWPAFRQFFDEVVLADVPPEVLDLLLRTCVLDVLTTERCARLIGADLAPGLLESLVRDHALPISVHGDSYRYEPLFRAYLAMRLGDRLGAAGLRESHRRAAEMLTAEEAYPQAARALARAGDWAALQLLFAESGAAAVQQPTADLIDLVPATFAAEEPWLVYADATYRRNESQLSLARDGFRQAAAMFTARGGAGDSEGLRLAEKQLAEVESLLTGRPPGQGLHWTGWLRAAVGPHAVENTRKITDLPPGEAELIRLVGAIFGGGAPDEMTRDTHTAGIDLRDSSSALLALRLVRTCIAVARGKQSPAALERIADEAESQGLGWIGRLALGARALGRGPYTALDAYAAAAACRRSGDPWGHLLLGTVGAICEVRDGRLDEKSLATLRNEATEMGAESIAAWAESFGVLSLARREAPDAVTDAEAAIDRAEAAGVAGAVALGLLALAVADPIRRPMLLRQATDRAAAGELPRATFKFWLATYAADAAAPGAPAINIRCFGGFAIAVNGRVLDLSPVRPRARSALRLLAMQAGRFVHREVLIEALWADLTPAAATRNLQVTISALRGVLEPGSGRGKAHILVRSGDAYGITLPPGGYADTAVFTDAVHRWEQQRRTGSFASEVDAMHAALAAYGGELLPEEGPAEWAVQARDNFRQLAARVARELATAELAQGNVAEAIRAAEQGITLDPHDDDVWQVLLRAYGRSGTPAKALDARRRYAEMLARLGVSEPTEQQIRGGQGSRPVL
jgi:DNA-binding SARP family transcriptional activator